MGFFSNLEFSFSKHMITLDKLLIYRSSLAVLSHVSSSPSLISVLKFLTYSSRTWSSLRLYLNILNYSWNIKDKIYIQVLLFLSKVLLFTLMASLLARRPFLLLVSRSEYGSHHHLCHSYVLIFHVMPSWVTFVIFFKYSFSSLGSS